MLSEAASRSRSAADVGCESIGGIVAAYDNTTTSKIYPRSCHSWPGRTHSAILLTADTSLNLQAIITVRGIAFFGLLAPVIAATDLCGFGTGFHSQTELDCSGPLFVHKIMHSEHDACISPEFMKKVILDSPEKFPVYISVCKSCV